MTAFVRYLSLWFYMPPEKFNSIMKINNGKISSKFQLAQYSNVDTHATFSDLAVTTFIVDLSRWNSYLKIW